MQDYSEESEPEESVDGLAFDESDALDSDEWDAGGMDG